MNVVVFKNIFSLNNLSTLLKKTLSISFGIMECTVKQHEIIKNRLRHAERRALALKLEVKSICQEISILQQKLLLFDESNADLATKSSILETDLTDGSNSNTCCKRELEDETQDNLNNKKPKVSFLKENGYVLVYTDGACENNGKANAKAGIGVWFGDDHPLNISKPVLGRATNNTAEIQACVAALTVLKNHGEEKVKILTDSQFTINCITKWIKNWKRNGWRLSSGGPVKNKEDLVNLDQVIQAFNHIDWVHVAGHKGIKGNEEADRLACLGATLYQASSKFKT